MGYWGSPEGGYEPPLESDYAPRQVQPDTKPAKRVRASQAEWAEIHQHFEHACCVSCGLAYRSLHHILPRSQGGSDIIVNLAPLCGDGTMGCHGILESHAPGWERVAGAIRQFVIVDVARRRYQEDNAPGFNDRYPPLPHPEAEQIREDFETIRESHAAEGFEAA